MNDFKRGNRFGGKPSFGGRPGFGRKPMSDDRPKFSATCATCGVPVQVPFKPDGSRPIYCREHISNLTFMSGRTPNPERPVPKREYLKRDFRSAPAHAPVRAATPDPRLDTVLAKLEKLQTKMDQILLEIAVAKAQSVADATRPAAKAPAKKKKAVAKKK